MMISLSLNGSWKMRKLADQEWIRAEVPGSVLNDLLVAGIIEDPFYTDNYFDLSANETKVLEIKKEDIYQDISLEDLKEQLRVRSLWESYR